MKLHRFAVPALAILMGAGGMGLVRAARAQGGPPQGYYGQDRGDWNGPPSEFNDMQRRGFQDGIEGAQKDFENHRQPNVENRDEYRHPHLPPELREDYREGFRRGYYVGMRHLMGGPGYGGQGYGGQAYGGPPPQMLQRPWDMPPDAYNEWQRRGFHDGLEGARKDFGNNRRPDVNNRDEYRDPDLPGEAREAYRDGFRRGYAVGVRHFYGSGYRRDDDDRD